MSARSRKGPAEPSWLSSGCQRQPDELYLMCDDIHASLAELRAKGVEAASDVSDQGCGLLAAIRLPDGAEFPLYQPGARHRYNSDPEARSRPRRADGKLGPAT